MTDGETLDAITTVAELRAKLEGTTPGTWEWFGNTKMHDVALCTRERGRIYVMDFERWGMRNAQPRFQVRLNEEPGSGIMRSIGELGAKEDPLGPKFEVPYRRQFVGIGHPDAAWIAAAHPDAIRKLFAVIDAIEDGDALLSGTKRLIDEKRAAVAEAARAEKARDEAAMLLEQAQRDLADCQRQLLEARRDLLDMRDSVAAAFGGGA